jgi:hypothetical protein
MSARAWIAVCLSLVLGYLVGWTARGNSTNDRFIRSSIARMDAETRYYNDKTDQMIRENEKTIKGAKTP